MINIVITSTPAEEMARLLSKLQEDMELRDCAECTKDSYTRTIKRFAAFLDKPITEATETDVRRYLLHMVQNEGLQTSTVNYQNAGLRFFFEYTLERGLNQKQVPRFRGHKKLPPILEREDIDVIFESILNLKHKAIYMLMYGSGLRVQEVVSLRISDIDSKNMQVAVHDGKGGKDRFAILSETSLLCLREYYKQYRPKDWLFEGRDGDHLSRRAAQISFTKYVKAANISKSATVHTLRHSFATHLLDAGTDLYTIKHLLGHSDIRSTTKYLQIRAASRLNLRSPLDSVAAHD